MSVPALALAPVLIDPSTGTGANVRTLNDELLDRAARDDYHAWLAGTAAAGGCVRPVRLRGTIRDIHPATGEVVRTLDTATLPDKVLYTPCGDRRASVCPSCAETYRRDTYQLIRAGLIGGKNVPETVRTHPCVFATFTAPSFGPVHTRRELPGGRAARCRPRRKADLCQHGRRLSCGQRHKDTDPTLGRPLCPDCYDYAAAVVWNVHAPELWRRTTIAIRRQLAKTARAAGAGKVQLAYAKVAEFQARGLVHFHAIFRLDGHTRMTRASSPRPRARHRPLSCSPTLSRPPPPQCGSPPSPTRPNPRLGHPLGRPARHRASSGLPATAARSPTSPWRPTWPSTPPRAPRPPASRPAGSPQRTLAVYADKRTHQGTADHAPAWHHRQPPAPGLPGAAPLGAHARLPRPLRHQKPPLLHHHARSPHRPPQLAAPPARPSAEHDAGQTVVTLDQPRNGPDEAGAPAETRSSPCRPPPEHATTADIARGESNLLFGEIERRQR